MKRTLLLAVCGLLILGAGWKLAVDAKKWWPVSESSGRISPVTVHLDETSAGALRSFNQSEGASVAVAGWGSFRDPGLEEAAKLRQEVKSLLASKDFAKLEARAQELRSTRAEFVSGASKLPVFYDALCPDRAALPDEWKKMQDLLEQWTAQSPESVTARVAFAEFLTSYAWRARGSGWASTVSPEGASLFEDRLAHAWEELKQARSSEPKDPYWWAAAQTVALGQGWDRKSYNALFDEAIALDPDFAEFYIRKATYLLPRWYGQSGEWEEFLKAAAERRGEKGAQLYAKVVSNLSGFFANVFNESKISWEQTRAGADQLIAAHPESVKLLVDYVRLAQKANDRTWGATAMKKVGNRIDPEMWKGWREVLMLRNWAGDESPRTP